MNFETYKNSLSIKKNYSHMITFYLPYNFCKQIFLFNSEYKIILNDLLCSKNNSLIYFIYNT